VIATVVGHVTGDHDPGRRFDVHCLVGRALKIAGYVPTALL
jgi:hypothetical protein